MRPPDTLELVVPPRARVAEVEAFLRAQESWITAARQDLLRFRQDCRLPVEIELAATGDSWQLGYEEGSRPQLRQFPAQRRLIVAGPAAGQQAAPSLLRNWLRARARIELVPWLQREAAGLGLEPAAVQVRLQKTRWGSCSSSGRISLNAALLLVRPALVRYLFVHELCHLQVMNHGRRYWRLVGQHEPDYRALDRELSAAWAALPWWICSG